MKLLPVAVVLLLAIVVIHCVPSRRDAENDQIGEPAVHKKAKKMKPPKKGDSDDGSGNDDDVPDNNGDKKKRFIVYGSSSSSSSSSLPPVATTTAYSGPIKDHKKDGGTGKAGGCSAKYKALIDNTMCVFYDDPQVIEYGITAKDIEFIVDQHNKYRSEVNAEDMVKMYWDPELAILAQKLAQACYRGHDSNKNRKIPGYEFGIGQNWCGGTKDWKTCLALWAGEVKDFKYGFANNFMKVGHWTQIVNDKATAVGCGYAYCPKKGGGNYFCNYVYGQTNGDIKTPYEEGTDCLYCPDHCVGQLCDCGAKHCNHGQLNLNTCECDCTPPYIGSDCMDVDCDIENRWFCKKDQYPATKCGSIQMKDWCRWKCGLCK